mmetsp:Transcript_22923/g.54801  ORF Transcript_22923/g.54801 Transcript_22923/m.54801 type:complete len:209 (-) Transcript_22923:197-823(-)
MPDARVAIHPPREENSIESGSWPMVYPRASRRRFPSIPMIPASIHTSIFSRSTHLIAFISFISRLTIIRCSPAGHSSAPETLVPPPKGMTTTLCSFASFTIASTCSCDPGHTTRSGTRSRVPNRTVYTSWHVWPCPWKMRSVSASDLRLQQVSSPAINASCRTGGDGFAGGCFGTTSVTSRPVVSSTHGRKCPSTCPLNKYRLPASSM